MPHAARNELKIIHMPAIFYCIAHLHQQSDIPEKHLLAPQRVAPKVAYAQVIREQYFM
jgi:hypothetical protein